MANIILKNVSKKYGNNTIIKNLNLEIEDGSFTVLVGPSGCGKSTILRMIAGLEQVNGGIICIGNREVTDVQPGKREISMVFQNYALYPTMTVKQNIEFGLKNKKVERKDREKVIQEICEIVGLSECLNRKPAHLSGGQRQRVALARAMVKKPKVFLMDEPLSNLDAKLRIQMRTELIQLHKRLGTTFLYVTHDQVEAMSMGDKIVVMNEGEIKQAANPVELYREPENLFTAQFVGAPPMNIITFENPSHGFTRIGFRPEKSIISQDKSDNSFSIQGKIVTREILGSETIYHIKTNFGGINVKSYSEVFNENIDIFVNIDYSNIYFFDEEGKRLQGRNELFSILKNKENCLKTNMRGVG
ncbi:ATP-binding cassette domain-containing protein [Iocasia frigidifontis]|uniref:ATP-binding cassette domain-containing protein n=1 Tax=Iocasia fonsfrigidae TaxID=2682810 RepID=A0A8A7KDQ4_9FIRM|nr:ATP-binding cassette domain-containing protein [Iocasia fonsfrigidae]